MKNVVISGSASLQDKIQKWFSYWESSGYSMLDYPKPIEANNFSEVYPSVHSEFYKNLSKTDLHFIANEEKKGIKGYIRPGVFAEIAYRVGLNLVNKETVPIILAHTPSKDVYFYNDLNLWLSLGWIQLLDNKI